MTGVVKTDIFPQVNAAVQSAGTSKIDMHKRSQVQTMTHC